MMEGTLAVGGIGVSEPGRASLHPPEHAPSGTPTIANDLENPTPTWSLQVSAGSVVQPATHSASSPPQPASAVARRPQAESPRLWPPALQAWASCHPA